MTILQSGGENQAPLVRIVRFLSSNNLNFLLPSFVSSIMVASLTHFTQGSPGGFWREEGAQDDPFAFSVPFFKVHQGRRQQKQKETITKPLKVWWGLTSKLLLLRLPQVVFEPSINL